MRGLCVAIVITLGGCPEGESKTAPSAEPRGVANPGKTIRETKQNAERAVEAGVQRNDDALDRAMEGETPKTRGAR